ncbi:MAG: transposase, partial [Acidobacteria bacterium]|nr:transposase [Acidobacteriota bacterium]
MEPLQELSNQMGHPSADKLWQAVQRNNLPVTRKAVIALVQANAPRQVFKKRANYEGKIPAVEINDRWAADLIDYTAKPSPSRNGGDPFQYILIVQDIFSRKIFVHALRSKTAEVCEQAFASIVRRAGIPDRLDTDNGLEFRGPFDQYLVEEKIYHQVADSRNKNARATLDAAIKQLRQQLARIQAVEGHRDWASVLQRAADAYNDTVHTHLIGRAPDDVKGDATLQFDLRSQAARDIAHNDALISARARRLEHFGNFRVEQPQNKFERSFHPRFSDDVHVIKHVRSNKVVDEEGNVFPTRHVLAVPAHSGPINTEGMHGGSEQTDRLRSQILEPYKQRISDFVGDLGKFEIEVANYMKE